MRFLLLLLLFPLSAIAQPAGYYDVALGLNGLPLKTKLHDIIKNHNSKLYPLWNYFQQTDKKSNGKVWDIYSDKPTQTPPYEYSFGADQCGQYNGEGDCYNHEHSWPQSYFNSAYPMQSDLFHIYPTDGEVNARHSNFPYSTISNPTFTSQNGSKLGSNAAPGAPSGQAFEPIDAYKGDIARSYFYMATRYFTEDGSWQNWDMASGANLKPWAITLLLQWHHNDPVSAKETDRNNAIFAIQQNRNPFIDYPQFADCIWAGGDCSALSLNPVALKDDFRLYPNPAKGLVHVSCENCSILISDFSGRNVYYQPLEKKLEQDIQIAFWSKGIYLVRMVNDRTSASQKLIVE